MSGETRARILIVEDEPSLVLTMTDRLEAEGYDVVSVGDGERALEATAEREPDLVLLDIALPHKDGYEVCRDLRAQGSEVPILMLTARSQLVDKVVGFKLGADDYLTKPFEMAELIARVEALLRRSRRQLSSSVRSYSFGDVSVDFRSAAVSRAGEPVALSALEFKLLRFFIENRDAVHGRDELLDKVWGYDATPTTRTVDVHVSSLRQKIEPVPSKPRYLLTVHGMGYRFVG
jgi:DNA-binding response OmpR family regulator